MKTKLKNWDRKDKIEARDKTIIKAYRYIFGQESIPEDKQYWTICGECVKNGELIENSEPDQIIKSKLITPSQFHGVEKEQEIHQINQSYTGLNFYYGDFYHMLYEHHINKSLNPAIINADFLKTPPVEIETFVDILYLLRNYSNVMVVGNFCRKYRGRDAQTVDEVINKNDFFKSFKKNWVIGNKIYEYISNICTMETAIFFRK